MAIALEFVWSVRRPRYVACCLPPCVQCTNVHSGKQNKTNKNKFNEPNMKIHSPFDRWICNDNPFVRTEHRLVVCTGAKNGRHWHTRCIQTYVFALHYTRSGNPGSFIRMKWQRGSANESTVACVMRCMDGWRSGRSKDWTHRIRRTCFGFHFAKIFRRKLGEREVGREVVKMHKNYLRLKFVSLIRRRWWLWLSCSVAN